MEFVELAIFTDQVEQVTRFYQNLFNRAPLAQGPGMAIFQLGNTKILIHEKSPEEPGQVPNQDHFAFGHTDIDTECQRLEQSGFEIAFPPVDYDWGRSAYLRDPDGRLVELNQTKG
jgi:predicted enzyme related to lactoylglutathione lyase